MRDKLIDATASWMIVSVGVFLFLAFMCGSLVGKTTSPEPTTTVDAAIMLAIFLVVYTVGAVTGYFTGKLKETP